MPQGKYLHLTKEQIALVALKLGSISLQTSLAKQHPFHFCGRGRVRVCGVHNQPATCTVQEGQMGLL